jgi:hypothetical protein
VQWSELQRDPKSVAALADAGDVRVRRRDGAALILTREDRTEASGAGAFAVVRALRSLIAHVPVELAATALAEEFPWANLLPADDLPLFVADFIRATRVSAELSEWSVLARVLNEWKATAAVHADPSLLRQLTEPLTEDHGPVPRLVEVGSGASEAR